MATFKEDVKQNLREAFEQRTGIVGQVLKERRQKQAEEKEVATQLAKIQENTARIQNDNNAFRKIEISTIQISENLQLINQWAGAQVTTQQETHEAFQEQPVASLQAKELEAIRVPDIKEEQSALSGILDLFDKLGSRIKRKFPKGMKLPKGAGAGFKGKVKKILKHKYTKGAILTGLGIAAIAYTGGAAAAQAPAASRDFEAERRVREQKALEDQRKAQEEAQAKQQADDQEQQQRQQQADQAAAKEAERAAAEEEKARQEKAATEKAKQDKAAADKIKADKAAAESKRIAEEAAQKAAEEQDVARKAKLQKEADEKEKKAADERAKAEKIDADEKIRKEKAAAELEAKTKAEREAKAKAEQEAKAKADREAKAAEDKKKKQEELDRLEKEKRELQYILDEKKAKEEAEKKTKAQEANPPPKAAVTVPKPIATEATTAERANPPGALVTTKPTAAVADKSVGEILILGPDVTMSPLNPIFAERLTAMAIDFKEKTGKPLRVNAGFRDSERQNLLYSLWRKAGGRTNGEMGGKKGDNKAITPNTAKAKADANRGLNPDGTPYDYKAYKEAVSLQIGNTPAVSAPGTSMHEFGAAVDIQPTSGPEGTGTSKGYLQELTGPLSSPTKWLEQFGLSRPIGNEPWHVQLNDKVQGEDGEWVAQSNKSYKNLRTGAVIGAASTDVESLKIGQISTKNVIIVAQKNLDTKYVASAMLQRQSATGVAVG